MAVIAAWFDAEQTIIAHEYYGKWTWEEVYSAVVAARVLALSVNHNVYTFSIQRDDAARHHVPSNVLTHFPILVNQIAPNIALHVVVLVGRVSFWRNLTQSIRLLYPRFGQYIMVVDSEEAALQIIADHKAQDALAGNK